MKKLYIETVGCQMNVLDSEMVVAALRKEGYALTQDVNTADTILFNTCSVREHAEEKAYSNLANLKRLKLAHPEKIIGVMGCMAQKDQKLVFDRAPYVDLVVGPGQLHRIPELLHNVSQGEGQQLAVSLGRKDGTQDDIRRSHETFDPLRDPEMRPTPFQAYLRIQIGCDKFCTYCIVPMTRGPEQGRPPAQIVAEAHELANQGCKEIVLLGQTVNSYRYKEGDKVTRLSDLLALLNEIEGIERIKFVTNYPKDMTRELWKRYAISKSAPPIYTYGSKWIGCCPQEDEAWIHHRRLSRNDGSHSRDSPFGCRFQRLHRWFLWGNRCRFSSHGRPRQGMPLQEQLYLPILGSPWNAWG